MVEDHEEIVAELLLDRVRLALLVAEERLQQIRELVHVHGPVATLCA